MPQYLILRVQTEPSSDNPELDVQVKFFPIKRAEGKNILLVLETETPEKAFSLARDRFSFLHTTLAIEEKSHYDRTIAALIAFRSTKATRPSDGLPPKPRKPYIRTTRADESRG